MRPHHSTATALAVVLGFAASVSAQSQQVRSEPPVEVANPETKLDVTPTGTPIINIAKPREDGTSYNVFKRFNVGAEGLIFNNSPTLGSTALGGQTLANPNLIRSGTSAKLILNEVIGGTRSDLNGPIEVFGPKASIIIANAAGITCDGCGFFNIDRVGLSTGRMVFGADGAFTGLAVAGGAVDIKGKGLLAGNVDYFDIIAATTTLNASLYARDLVVVGGNSNYDYASRTATSSGGGNSQLAIDSSLLGGMYANRIRLIGSGAGVGINLQGVVTALEGPIEINADGNISVKNAVAAGDANFNSLSGNIRIDERLYAGGQASIDAKGNIVQSGDFIAAAKDVSLKSGGDITLGGSGLYAGLASDGRLSGEGAISINAAGAIDVAAVQAIATKSLKATANSISQGTGSSLSAAGVDLEAATRLALAGEVQSQAAFSAKADIIDLSGAAVANGALGLTSRQLRLTGDAIGVASATAAVGDAVVIGGAGSLQSNGVVTLNAVSIENQGRVMGVGGASVTATGNLESSGAILSGASLVLGVGGNARISGAVSANTSVNVLVAGTASVAGAIAAAGNLDVAAQSLALSGTLSSGRNLAVKTPGAFDAAAGSIMAADGNIAIDAASVRTRGYTSAAGTLGIISDNVLEASGQLHAGGNLALSGTSLILRGNAVSNADATLTIGGAATLDGTFSADGAVTLSAASLTTGAASQTVAAGDIAVVTSSDLVQQGAISGNAVSLISGTSVNISGSVYAKGNLTLTATNLIGNSGSLEAAGRLAVSAVDISSNGRLVGIGGAAIVGRDLLLGAASNLQSGGQLLVDASQSLQTAGSILSIGIAELKSAGDFDQRANISLGNAARLVAGGRLL
ncbi:MAG: filamentous hemagglutinin N-terminal domain-containing protein, partial [Sphingomonadaceae bacterium]|nr:filamentous hemagglutinin N-terminal domain-containing protein [Sphingomonadaceae bacterium]